MLLFIDPYLLTINAPTIIGENISEVFMNCITEKTSAATVSQVDDNNPILDGVLIHTH